MELLKQSYVIYKSRKGRYCTTIEEYLYMITRIGMQSVYKEIMHRRVNVDKIDQSVLEMVSFGDNESFNGINGFKHLPMPEEVEKSIKLMQNNRYIFKWGGNSLWAL